MSSDSSIDGPTGPGKSQWEDDFSFHLFMITVHLDDHTPGQTHYLGVLSDDSEEGRFITVRPDKLATDLDCADREND